MELGEFIKILKNKKQTILTVMLLFILLAVAFTFVQPQKYSSESKLLVIQELPAGIDPYQISKSNEYVSSLLTQVILANSFFRETLNAGFNINKNYFPESGDKQMRMWKKTVKVSSDANGIISIKVYNNNRVQVDQINQAIDFVLINKHQLYHGFGDAVKIKIIEQPVTSDNPIQPNIFINIGFALAFGLLVSMTYVYLFPETRYNLHLSPTPRQYHSTPDNYNTQNTNTKQGQAMPDNTNKSVYVEQNYRRDMNPPVDLPIVDEEVEVKKMQNYQNQNFEITGNMENIINQPDQRG